MIIIALLGAILFYALIFLFFASARHRLDSLDGWLRLTNELIWRPDDTIFMILHGLIAITILYLTVDYLRASLRTWKRHRAERQLKKEKPELRRKELF